MKHSIRAIKKVINTDLNRIYDYLIFTIIAIIFFLLTILGVYYRQNAKESMQKAQSINLVNTIIVAAQTSKKNPFDDVITTLQKSQDHLTDLVSESKKDIVIAFISDVFNIFISVIYQYARHKDLYERMPPLWSKIKLCVIIIIIVHSIYSITGDFSFYNHYFREGLAQEITNIYSVLDYEQLTKPYH